MRMSLTTLWKTYRGGDTFLFWMKIGENEAMASEYEQALTQAKKQWEELVDQLNQARVLYYDLDRPTLSDAAYDQLFRQLGTRGTLSAANKPRFAYPNRRGECAKNFFFRYPSRTDGFPR